MFGLEPWPVGVLSPCHCRHAPVGPCSDPCPTGCCPMFLLKKLSLLPLLGLCLYRSLRSLTTSLVQWTWPCTSWYHSPWISFCALTCSFTSSISLSLSCLGQEMLDFISAQPQTPPCSLCHNPRWCPSHWPPFLVPFFLWLTSKFYILECPWAQAQSWTLLSSHVAPPTWDQPALCFKIQHMSPSGPN